MVDLSYTNASPLTTAITANGTTHADTRTIRYSLSASTYGEPITWKDGTTPTATGDAWAPDNFSS